MKHLATWIFAALFLVPPLAATAADDPPVVGFTSEEWTIRGEVVEHLGREALAGSGLLDDVRFADGVIEVDVAVDGRRCFPGIVFRAQSEADTEVFYFRPHRPVNYTHALQYAPRFRGLTGWQLYSGPGYTATTEIDLNRWIPIRIEVKGTRARIFFDDMEQPALMVDHLARGTAAGFIGVTGPSNGAVYWSNFRYSGGDGLDFGPHPIRPATQGDLVEWEISQPIAPSTINRDLDPMSQALGELEWTEATPDSSGLVDVARFLEEPPRLPGSVIARTTITSGEAERRKLVFGYSDEVSVFLNGRLLFRGDSGFRVRDSEFMGVIGLNDAVVLDLVEGENALTLVVTESFGGWGFTARTERLHSGPVVLADCVSKAWELTEGLVMPESAAWDPRRKVFYISNMNPIGTDDRDESGFVSRVDPTGESFEPRWATGLRQPTGTAVLGDRLYVVERTGVAIIDVGTGAIVERRAISPEGGFLNDLAVAADGTVFVSDSSRGVIYRSTSDGAETWLDGPTIAGVNGLVVVGTHLYATTMGSESMVGVDLRTGSMTTILELHPFGGDGITDAGDGAFLVTDYHGLLLRVTPAGSREVLVDSRDSGISLTDHGYAVGVGLVLIPTLRGNSAIAYELDVDRCEQTGGGTSLR